MTDDTRTRDILTAALGGLVIVAVIVFGILRNSSDTLILGVVGTTLLQTMNLVRSNRINDKVERIETQTNGNMSALIDRNSNESRVTSQHQERQAS